jgi:hypothetical protein
MYLVFGLPDKSDIIIRPAASGTVYFSRTVYCMYNVYQCYPQRPLIVISPFSSVTVRKNQ